MSFNRQSFSDLSVPKTRREKIRDGIRGTVGALALATSVLAISAIENKGHGAENEAKERATATQPHKTEKELPRIAYDNPQIYEFLEGNVTSQDTLPSLQKKLEKRISTLAVNLRTSDDFSYHIAAEIRYQQEIYSKSSDILSEAYTRLQQERESLGHLSKFLKTLKTENIGDMNDALITYYDQIGWDIMNPQEIERYKQQITAERKRLGYSYGYIGKWVAKYEKQTKGTK